MQKDSRSQSPHSLAKEFFYKSDFIQAKKVLLEAKQVSSNSQLDSLLCELKEQPTNSNHILKKITDILVTLNIEIYQQKMKGQSGKSKLKVPRINHEFYFVNIISIALHLGLSHVAELIANQALHYIHCMRTQTSLCIIYHMLKLMVGAGRLTCCISIIEKQRQVINKAKKLSETQQKIRFLNQILSNQVLLKLGMIQGSKQSFMMKFNQSQQTQIASNINGIPLLFYQQTQNAEIQYHALNWKFSMKVLSDLVQKIQGNNKRQYLLKFIDHNLALILLQQGQKASAQLIIKKISCDLINTPNQLIGNQKNYLVQKCKQNIVLAHLSSKRQKYSPLYEQIIRQSQISNSFKVNYRKAQLCIKYYQELLKNQKKQMAYKDIHDFYETVYYYPNMPYFQQKSKNKNPNFTNNKFYYRRYVLPDSQYALRVVNQPEPAKQQKKLEKQPIKQSKKQHSKEKKKQKVSQKVSKGKKQEIKQQIKQNIKLDQPKFDENKINNSQWFKKLSQILNLAKQLCQNSLLILEKQKNLIVKLQNQQETNLTQQANKKLQNQHEDYKANLYCLLCYIHNCKKDWIKTINYAQKYQKFQKQCRLITRNSFHMKNFYNIISYKLQAYSELNRITDAYECLRQLSTVVDYGQNTPIQAQSTTSIEKGQIYFQTMNLCNNFLYNMSVLHSKDNQIPQAFASIQKLLQQMRMIPTNPQTNLPLSMVELLIHYNLRTHNESSALQMIKRKRILNITGVLGYQPTLNITK